jgi:hypothetical protein
MTKTKFDWTGKSIKDNKNFESSRDVEKFTKSVLGKKIVVKKAAAAASNKKTAAAAKKYRGY